MRRIELGPSTGVNAKDRHFVSVAVSDGTVTIELDLSVQKARELHAVLGGLLAVEDAAR
jgi:hypothetical protein